MEKKEFDLDVNKLMRQKLEKIKSTLLNCKSIEDLRKLLSYTKFSIDSLRKGNIKFDENDTLWRSMSESFDKVNKIESIGDIKKLCILINSIEEINLSVLDSLECNQEAEDNLVKKIKDRLFKIKEDDDLNSLVNEVLDIKRCIEKSPNWKSMRIPNTVMEVINGCTVIKKDIEMIDMDSFIINMSIVFNGLLKNYVPEGSNSRLGQVMRLSEKVSNLLSDNLSNDELKILRFKKCGTPFITEINILNL